MARYKVIENDPLNACLIDEKTGRVLVNYSTKDPRDSVWIRHLIHKANETERYREILIDTMNYLIIFPKSSEDGANIQILLDKIEDALGVIECDYPFK